MRQERRAVFETNSSSTHSICIVKCRKSELLLPSKLTFHCGEFGWEWMRYSDMDSKASYLYTAILLLYSPTAIEDLKRRLYDWLAQDGIDADFEEPIRNKRYDYYENIDIDHVGETREFVEAVMHSKNRLYRYLFSENSFVLTGNDNEWDEDCNVDINVDYKHEEYYKGN